VTDAGTGRLTFDECHACLAICVCPRCDTENAMTSVKDPACRECGWNLDTLGEPLAVACTCSQEASHA
jgi:hypothetical protein